VLSTLRYFRDEYEAHIKDKRCPAGVCKALITYRIDQDKCTACGKCRKVCPSDAITGEKKVPHTIDPEKCIRCGACISECKFDAIEVV
jgi:NAD-dependent dihydropyrimidine dehydrogenase PreA subunit